MHTIEFWGPLIISFIAFKFEDMFIAILFAIVALAGLVQAKTMLMRKSLESRHITTRKGRISISLDTRLATEKDIEELDKLYAETISVFRELIAQRDKLKK